MLLILKRVCQQDPISRAWGTAQNTKPAPNSKSAGGGSDFSNFAMGMAAGFFLSALIAVVFFRVVWPTCFQNKVYVAQNDDDRL